MDNKINLYEQLGSIQFQLEKLFESKENLIKQIELQMTINSVKQQVEAEQEKL